MACQYLRRMSAYAEATCLPCAEAACQKQQLSFMLKQQHVKILCSTCQHLCSQLYVAGCQTCQLSQCLKQHVILHLLGSNSTTVNFRLVVHVLGNRSVLVVYIAALLNHTTWCKLYRTFNIFCVSASFASGAQFTKLSSKCSLHTQDARAYRGVSRGVLRVLEQPPEVVHTNDN